MDNLNDLRISTAKDETGVSRNKERGGKEVLVMHVKSEDQEESQSKSIFTYTSMFTCTILGTHFKGVASGNNTHLSTVCSLHKVWLCGIRTTIVVLIGANSLLCIGTHVL